MKRIVKLDGQGLNVSEDELTDKCFAIYDTVRDKFDTAAGDQIFDNVVELEACFDTEIRNLQHQKMLIDTSSDIMRLDADIARLHALKIRCSSLARSNGY